MKKNYLLLGGLLLGQLLSLQAAAQTDWRPFRPKLIYSYATGVTTNSSIFLLRLDSAYTTAGGDSVWAFNRLLRPANNGVPANYAFASNRKSRNNLFGAKLIWRPGSSEFVLENVGEGSSQSALSLTLRPRAAVGSTWAASTAPALSATLTSRAWQPVSSAAGSPSDSVATITLSSGQVLRLSRRYGLLEGPRWLSTASGTEQWTITALPATLAQSPLYPATLFTWQPGNVLGYEAESYSSSPITCSRTYILRQIVTRQIVGDSLLLTFREQSRTQNSGAPGCGTTAGSIINPVQMGRIALSLRTGQSPQYPALSLLTGEYKADVAGFPQALWEGLGLLPPTSGSCGSGSVRLVYRRMYPQAGMPAGTYMPGLDALGWYQTFDSVHGLGDVATYYTMLQYYDLSSSGGGICGTSQPNYAGLLPIRAAQAAAIASLHPNPAADAAMLMLTAPARPDTRVTLRDVLGRVVWETRLATGQTNSPIPLANQPAGVYLVQVETASQAAVTLRLVKE
jgi:hypothetical protein